ncbi:purine and uridine phosphorylase [Trichoderma ceciliae]
MFCSAWPLGFGYGRISASTYPASVTPGRNKCVLFECRGWTFAVENLSGSSFMAHLVQPASRDDFHVAIICALPSEADAVTLLFDQFWDEESDPYGRANGDTNTYITGRLGKHNVVLAVLPSMGTNSAAAATASLRSSYNSLKIAFLVGVCGGVPRITDYDVFLGDVVVSKAIVQYDFGRQYPGHFAVKTTVEDSLGRANKDIQGMLAVFETELMRERLQTKSTVYLKQLQDAAKKKRRRAKYQYPGIAENTLYRPGYIHRHAKLCKACGKSNDSGSTCEAASKTSCVELGCEETQLVKREIPFEDDGDFTPSIFIGRIGSGNTVMKSGEIRDWIASKHNLIAFEMEGAGAWESVPCLVVKGVCDYADSHKNKRWQDFAAATAACAMKAILDRYIVTDVVQALASTQPNGHGRGNSTRSISGNTFGDNVRISQGDMSWNTTR